MLTCLFPSYHALKGNNPEIILFFIVGYNRGLMSQDTYTHKENGLLTRGIFCSSDFDAFQKSEVGLDVVTLITRS